jgi:CheY-like chemotaxis protein
LKRVVVIDDNKELAFVLKKRLEFENVFSVESFEDSEKAVKYACKENPDLVITDFSMPKISGGEVLERIKKHSPNIKVAICSVYYDDDQTISAEIKEKADLILKKPFDEDDIRKIKRALNLEVRKNA